MPGAHNKYNINYSSTSEVNTDDMAMAIEEMITVSKNRRKIFERRWYDNMFLNFENSISNNGCKLLRELGGTPERTIPSRAGLPEGVQTMYEVSLWDKDIVGSAWEHAESYRNVMTLAC